MLTTENEGKNNENHTIDTVSFQLGSTMIARLPENVPYREALEILYPQKMKPPDFDVQCAYSHLLSLGNVSHQNYEQRVDEWHESTHKENERDSWTQRRRLEIITAYENILYRKRYHKNLFIVSIYWSFVFLHHSFFMIVDCIAPETRHSHLCLVFVCLLCVWAKPAKQ